MSTVMEVHEPSVAEQSVARVAVHPSSSPKNFAPTLFADVLLEPDRAEKQRRKWSAVTSIILQSVLVGVALIVPLLFTEALPKAQLLTFLVAPVPPPPPPPPAAAAPAQALRHIQSDFTNGQLRTPSRIPQKVQMIREEEAPPQINSGGGVIGGVPGGIPGGQLGGVIGGIVSSTSSLTAVPKLSPVATPKRVRISQGVVAGMLIHKVSPTYPPIARQARVTGQVVLSAVISKEGTVENLRVVSGHPMLVEAALNAVRQWQYRPYLLNGEPVEVESAVTVIFQLSD